MPDSALRQTVQDALGHAVAEVLEKMFFIRVLEDADDGAAPEPECASAAELVAGVRFHGAPSGELSVRLSACVARGIAADFLGLEESELSRRQVEEVVCELANMICGAVLSRVESTATFRLDSPVTTGLATPNAAMGEMAVHVFPIGSGHLTATVSMEVPACSPAKSGS